MVAQGGGRSARWRRRRAIGSFDPQLLFDDLLDGLRVGLALAGLHDLTDEPAGERGLGLRLFDLVGIGGDHLVDHGLDRAGIGDLLHAARLDDLGGYAALGPDDLEELLADLRCGPAHGGCIGLEEAPVQAPRQVLVIERRGGTLIRLKDFAEIGIGDVALVGGKNASLGVLVRELTPLGVRVPGGFAVTAGIGIDEHVNRFEAEHDDYSAILLKALADRLVTALGERLGDLHKNPRQSGAFTVLKAAEVPSVLIELGFLSNPDDRQNLIKAEWRAEAQLAIRDALTSWAVADAAEAELLRR